MGNKAGPLVHGDLFQRDFTRAAANELQLTHVSEHRKLESEPYTCAIRTASIPPQRRLLGLLHE